MSGIRVAMLPLLPEASAATRAVCVRPLPVLRAAGFDVTVMLPTGARVYARFRRPASPVRIPLSFLYWYGIVFPRRLVQIIRASGHDVVVVQRGLLRVRSVPLLEALLYALIRLRGRTLVYHCDDAVHTVARTPFGALRFRLATCVVTGSDDVAGAARAARARRVRHLEGGVDIERYPVRQHEQRRPVVVGWVGTNPHEHLEPILGALRHLVIDGRARLRVVSGEPFEGQGLGDGLEWRRWSPDIEHEAFRDLDIGIMPLRDTPYNRGKEAYKLKEYMAAGLPVVCSPVGHNLAVVEHGITGFFATDEQEWADRLAELVACVELRATMGAAGRRRAVELYDARSHAERLGEILLEAVPERSANVAGVAAR